MKRTKGQANAQVVKQLFDERLAAEPRTLPAAPSNGCKVSAPWDVCRGSSARSSSVGGGRYRRVPPGPSPPDPEAPTTAPSAISQGAVFCGELRLCGERSLVVAVRQLSDRAYTSTDVEGLANTIRRVQVGVYSVANGDTEDVVQEALARAIKSGVSLEAEQWLRTVAKRVAIDQHRRRRETPSGAPDRARELGAGDRRQPGGRVHPRRAVGRPCARRSPRCRRGTARRSRRTPRRTRRPAVAKRLGLSAAATWTLLSRARTRLRLQLESVGFVPALVGMARGRAGAGSRRPVRPPASLRRRRSSRRARRRRSDVAVEAEDRSTSPSRRRRREAVGREEVAAAALLVDRTRSPTRSTRPSTASKNVSRPQRSVEACLGSDRSAAGVRPALDIDV